MQPYTRHDEVPVFEYRPASVNANHFNRVTMALKREGGTLRLALPSLRHLDLILQSDAWIAADRALNDIPLLAWTEFDVLTDQRLHRPVGCRLRLFHAQAGLLLRQVLADLDQLLVERFATGDEGPAQVLPFPGGG